MESPCHGAFEVRPVPLLEIPSPRGEERRYGETGSESKISMLGASSASAAARFTKSCPMRSTCKEHLLASWSISPEYRGEAVTSLVSTTFDDRSPGSGPHTDPEPVFFLPSSDIGLVGTFHERWVPG